VRRTFSKAVQDHGHWNARSGGTELPSANIFLALKVLLSCNHGFYFTGRVSPSQVSTEVEQSKKFWRISQQLQLYLGWDDCEEHSCVLYLLSSRVCISWGRFSVESPWAGWHCIPGAGQSPQPNYLRSNKPPITRNVRSYHLGGSNMSGRIPLRMRETQAHALPSTTRLIRVNFT
jgi:hypothetical protein